MSGPVDVRKNLRMALQHVLICGPDATVQAAIREVDGAVAELVEAMERIAVRAKPHPDDTDADRKRDLYHIEAIASMALDRIGAAE